MNMLVTQVEKKIYCNNCTHLQRGIVILCRHPDNYMIVGGNWAQPPLKANGRSPANINKNNDCEWYKRKA